MSVLLFFEFPTQGPFGPDAADSYRVLASDISLEKGLRWKVWTEDPARSVAGGVYLFDSQEDADRYVELHTARLRSFGIDEIEVRAYEVNEQLSVITRGIAI